jgi:hypothetical protein
MYNQVIEKTIDDYDYESNEYSEMAESFKRNRFLSQNYDNGMANIDGDIDDLINSITEKEINFPLTRDQYYDPKRLGTDLLEPFDKETSPNSAMDKLNQWSRGFVGIDFIWFILILVVVVIIIVLICKQMKNKKDITTKTTPTNVNTSNTNKRNHMSTPSDNFRNISGWNVY